MLNEKSLFIFAITAIIVLIINNCSKSSGKLNSSTSSSTSSSEVITIGNTNYISKNIGILKYVPAGTFQSDGTNTDTATITSPFHISENDITRAQFSNVTGFDPIFLNPSVSNHSSGISDPVQYVNWYQAILFCNKLSLLEGLIPVYSIKSNTDCSAWGTPPEYDSAIYQIGDSIVPEEVREKIGAWDAVTANWSANGYRLPTEMEWMWAAMGADSSNPGRVNTNGYLKVFAGSAGTNNIEDYEWNAINSGGTTHPAGTKLPNEIGLFDMSGNEWQWCWGYQQDQVGAITNFREDYGDKHFPKARHILRGGDWSTTNISINYRFCDPLQGITGGFRVVRP